MDTEYVKMANSLEELLLDRDGSTMSIDEAVKRYGYRGVWIAALKSGISDRSKRPRLSGYPPRIFVSYRWESEEHKAWVKAIALHLQERGFEVVLDQFQSMDGPHLDAPQFISRIADCHYFLAVITPGYCDIARVLDGGNGGQGGRDGWVYDEHQTAMGLFNAGRIRLVGILKEGKRTPKGLGDNCIDLRGIDDPLLARDAIDRFFSYDGLVLSPEEQEEFVALIMDVDALLGSPDKAASRVERHKKCRYSETVEFKTLLARIYAEQGHRKEVIALAENVLAEKGLWPDSKLRIAQALYLCDMNAEALRLLVPLAKTREFEPFNVHYLMGDILREMNSFTGAIHHLSYAIQHAGGESIARLWNILGVAYKQDRQLNKAEDCFRKALELDSTLEVPAMNLASTLYMLGRIKEAQEQCNSALHLHPGNAGLINIKTAIETGDYPQVPPQVIESGPGFSCSHCSALYHLDLEQEKICGDCGALYREPKQLCSCCGNDGIVPITAWRVITESNGLIGCPICRKGHLDPE